MKSLEHFQPAPAVELRATPESLTSQKAAEMDQPLRPPPESIFKGVRTNIVQSIRAFRVHDLQDAAASLGQHFLYANLAAAQTKQDVLDMIAAQFTFPAHRSGQDARRRREDRHAHLLRRELRVAMRERWRRRPVDR